MSTTAVALGLELIIQLLSKSTEIASLINKVQSEGRTNLTDEEWNSMMTAYDTARSKLEEAIKIAKANPPPGG